MNSRAPKGVQRTEDPVGDALSVAGIRAAAEHLASGSVTARTADTRKLAKAEADRAKGAPVFDIWSDHGWFRGPDGRWRVKIPDAESGFLRAGLNETLDGSTADLRCVLSHPAHYDAYPQLLHMEVRKLAAGPSQVSQLSQGSEAVGAAPEP